VTPLLRYSVQSEIYAFGMLLYQLLTHHYPFERFVTESDDGSELSPSEHYWEFGDVHRKGEIYEWLPLMKRYAMKATKYLFIPSQIERECPVGYMALLKNCIVVRLQFFFCLQ
jgi:hypothetical protein